jgi:endonuclease/exonuclease/phosphatase family metal-dependent hydrolase
LVLERVSVVAWNVAHQVHPKPIPPDLAVALVHVGADVIFLTEFVDGPSRGPFRDQLHEAGYVYQAVTQAPARHNHVFAASRLPFECGDVSPPSMESTGDDFARSNFLHLCLRDSDIELIGVRAPWWDSKTNSVYRQELTAILRSAQSRALIVAGDLNEDPFKGIQEEPVAPVPFREADMYSVPRPAGAWSFTNHDGTRTSRIDHVLHTARVWVRDAHYVYDIEGIQLAGPRSARALSDHAALTFTAGLTGDGL